jgi:hypothetical protein
LIAFSRSCAPGQRLTVAAVGDLLFHRELEEEALTPTGSYRQFWQPVAQVLAKADLVYGNLEGTVADGVTEGGEIVKDPGRTWNNRVYTAPPLVLSFSSLDQTRCASIAPDGGLISCAPSQTRNP